MVNIGFKIAGKTLSISISRKKILNRLILGISLITLLYSLFMIFNTFFDYYKSYRLNEDLKQAYYGSDKDIAPQTTEVHMENVIVDVRGTGQEQAQDIQIPALRQDVLDSNGGVVLPKIDKDPLRYVTPYPGHIIPPVISYDIPVFKARSKEEILKDQYERIVGINKDVIGWIQIPGTNIDYPVVQAKDNQYYLKRNILEKWSFSGSIFADYRNMLKQKGKDKKKNLIRDRNIILYGHTMKNDSMFAQLKNFQKQEFFKANSIINFDIGGEHHEWEVFSVYVTELDFNYLITEFGGNEEFKQYLSTVKDKSIYKKKISLNEKDKILTLSTCSYDLKTKEARLVVHAKLIK